MRQIWMVVVFAACSPADDGGTDGNEVVFDDEGWPDAWVQLEDAVLSIVNVKRGTQQRCGDVALGGIGPLVDDDLLRRVARGHSQDMVDRGFFDHVNPDGDGPQERLIAAAFTGATPWGENIAFGYPSAEDVVDGWMSSVGHCLNIMESGFSAIGIGYVDDVDGPMWTQVFAGSGAP